MTTATIGDIRRSIRSAARAIDQALSDVDNRSDGPTSFDVGDHLAAARQHLAAALNEATR